MVVRRVLLALGLAFSVLGLAVAANPTLATRFPFPDLPVGLFGGFALVLAAATYVSRRGTEFRDPSDEADRDHRLETRFEPPRPGADLDQELRAGNAPYVGAGDGQLRERLRVLAAQVLSDANGISREEAHDRLDDGSWTDDPTAAAYFSDDVTAPARDLVGSIVGVESASERKAKHAVAELRRIAGLDTEDA